MALSGVRSSCESVARIRPSCVQRAVPSWRALLRLEHFFALLAFGFQRFSPLVLGQVTGQLGESAASRTHHAGP